jgi:UDPglucose 6-dehydrogenase
VVEESQGVELAHSLLNKGVPLVLYDPLAMDQARCVLGDGPVFASSLQECVQQTDVVVITTPWPEFSEIQPADLARNPKRPVVLDCWRMLDGERFTEVADYVALGLGL